MHVEEDRWSIDVWRGLSPFDLRPVNMKPALTARDVSDTDALFVADPFMLYAGGLWHMFYEVLERPMGRGVIGHATSTDTASWSHDGIVLRESFHLSYPFVFAADGGYWMVPETLGAGAVTLYRAANFPYDWEQVTAIAPGRAADPTLLWHTQRWWLFLCATPKTHDTLTLYGAENFRSSAWEVHPASPIVTSNASCARPAGRPFTFEGRLFRLAQNCSAAYGTAVTSFEIIELSRERYVERPAYPVAGPGELDWNRAGMHHVDAHELADGSWVAAVDGRRR